LVPPPGAAELNSKLKEYLLYVLKKIHIIEPKK